MGRNLFGTFDRLFLQAVAVEKPRDAIHRLRATHSALRLLILDGWRPALLPRLAA